MYVGAFVCAVVGYEIALPRGLHILVCIVAAGLAGMLFAMIPALLVPVEELCRQQALPVSCEFSMEELGRAAGIQVGAAVIALLNT